MLSATDNDLLTKTGPGTPMGDYVRRFWIPVLLSRELPEPDGAPLRVTVMGEVLDNPGPPGYDPDIRRCSAYDPLTIRFRSPELLRRAITTLARAEAMGLLPHEPVIESLDADTLWSALDHIARAGIGLGLHRTVAEPSPANAHRDSSGFSMRSTRRWKSRPPRRSSGRGSRVSSEPSCWAGSLPFHRRAFAGTRIALASRPTSSPRVCTSWHSSSAIWPAPTTRSASVGGLTGPERRSTISRRPTCFGTDGHLVNPGLSRSARSLGRSCPRLPRDRLPPRRSPLPLLVGDRRPTVGALARRGRRARALFRGHAGRRLGRADPSRGDQDSRRPGDAGAGPMGRRAARRAARSIGACCCEHDRGSRDLRGVLHGGSPTEGRGLTRLRRAVSGTARRSRGRLARARRARAGTDPRWEGDRPVRSSARPHRVAGRARGPA